MKSQVETIRFPSGILELLVHRYASNVDFIPFLFFILVNKVTKHKAAKLEKEDGDDDGRS